MTEDRSNEVGQLAELVESLSAKLNSQEQELLSLRMKVARHKNENRKSLFARAFLGSIVALIIFSTAALASIPASDGVITACYSSKDVDKGDLRVIDSAVTTCKNNETLLAWNQKGMKGDTGPQGPQGPAGSPGTGVNNNLICPQCDKVNANLQGQYLVGTYFPYSNLTT